MHNLLNRRLHSKQVDACGDRSTVHIQAIPTHGSAPPRMMYLPVTDPLTKCVVQRQIHHCVPRGRNELQGRFGIEWIWIGIDWFQRP